ncbi:MAG: transposase, partial [Bacteroidales bacterium]|nr:transposase [Bacteroidales bacterium]
MPCGVYVSAIKKTLFHPKADAAKRDEFAAKLHQYEQVECRPIIYMDESGFSVDAPRERGYSFKGKRCYGSKDWHSRGRVNAIGDVHHFKTVNICLFECNINADIFHAWTVNQLIPSLPERSV